MKEKRIIPVEIINCGHEKFPKHAYIEGYINWIKCLSYVHKKELPLNDMEVNKPTLSLDEKGCGTCTATDCKFFIQDSHNHNGNKKV